MASKPDRGADYARTVADKLIEQLREGTAPWQKPWDATGYRFMPYNPTSGADYKGMNAMWLMAQGRDDPRWMTYKQAAGEGAQVRKGEKGTQVQYWKFEDRVPVKDGQGNPIVDGDGKAVMRNVKLERPRVFTATVFNAGQIDGLPPPEQRPQPNEWEREQRVEAILKNSTADIRHQAGDRAYYSPGADHIVLPERGQFPDSGAFYGTALHELGHWTGHPSRLNRDLAHPFGSEGYAREELRAEISSLMLADQLGIPHNPDRHASYVASWIKTLENDPREIFRAASDAEKISRMVQGFEQQQAQAIGQPGQSPLDEPIGVTLSAEGADRSHYAAHGAGELEAALQAKGLGTVAAIVGRESTDFPTMFNTAIERLSPVYGIAPDFDGPTNAYYERKGLATDFATRGEQLVRGQGIGPAPAPDAPAAGEQSQLIATPILTDPSEVAMKTSPEPVYLAVPFAEKNEAKGLGAKWDKEAKSWFAPPGVDLAPLERWNPANQSVSSTDPRTEFKDALKEAGLIVDGLPQMDGQLVRVRVEGDKGKERSGTYVGHKDGRPAGYINNFRTGYEGPWKSSNAHAKALSGQERAKLAAEAAARRAQRDRERDQTHAATAHQIEALWERATPATAEHAYLAKKGVDSYGVRVDTVGGLALPAGAAPEDQQSFSRAGSLLVPLRDADGKLWAAQSIDPSGFKSLPKGGRYSGLFHMIGDEGTSGAILIGEGYATSADLHKATALPVAVAFSSNNLEAVALALREKHPDRPLIVAGDNDHRKPLELDAQGRPKPNVGREKAEAAAAAVDGYAMLPRFDADDRGTDWNDLKQGKGEAVFRDQVAAGLASAQRHGLARASRKLDQAPQLDQQQDRQQKRERPSIRIDDGMAPPRRARGR